MLVAKPLTKWAGNFLTKALALEAKLHRGAVALTRRMCLRSHEATASSRLGADIRPTSFTMAGFILLQAMAGMAKGGGNLGRSL